MKRLLTIIFLLLSLSANAQLQRIATGQQYNARAREFFNRVKKAGYSLNVSQKRWYNDSLFKPLYDAGLIGSTRAGDSLQALWVLATFPNGNANICYLNILSDSNTITNVNAVTITDSGCVGSGLNYLNTNFSPVRDSTIFKRNSYSFGVYCKTELYTDAWEMGFFTASLGWLMNNGFKRTSDTIGSVYSGTSTAYPIIIHSSLGTLFEVRQNCQFHYLMKNGSGSITSENKTTGDFGTNYYPFYICRYNYQGTPTSGTTRCFTFVFLGSGLSTTKATALSNILNNSLKGRKYNVY